MGIRRAIAIGGSAGALNALKALLTEIPANFPAPIFVVLHLPSSHKGDILVSLVAAHCALPVKEVADKDLIEAGVYLAPANYHLLVDDTDTLSLSVEAPVLFSRPSIDVLFESAADVYKDGLIAILLSGANEDGASGMSKVKSVGGVTIVQDPDEADSRYMPVAAMKAAAVDLAMRAQQIGQYLRDTFKEKG